MTAKSPVDECPIHGEYFADCLLESECPSCREAEQAFIHGEEGEDESASSVHHKTPEYSAEVFEDNAGGLTLYVIQEDTGKCVYAQSGYEKGEGQLRADLATLLEDDNIENWQGNEPEVAAAWADETAQVEGRTLIAEIATGVLYTYPDDMGIAGRREFGLPLKK